MTIIKTESVSKQYQMGSTSVQALSGIDFSIEAGEFVAVMGPSGSGKSTLLHILGGIDRPTTGDVILAGKRYSQLSDKDLTLIRRRRIGFVFQFFNLLPTMTAAENVFLPLLIDGKPRSECQSRAEEMLRLVGLLDRRDHKPDQLSGGEQQRVAIARALVTKPDIVLADELTGNLNSRAGEEIVELLRHACHETGQTIVMVTHDNHASSHAGRVVFLKDGHIKGETRLTDENGADIILKRMVELEI